MLRDEALRAGDGRGGELDPWVELYLRLADSHAGMGERETYEVTQLVRRLHKDQKLSIVLIEHDMRVVFHLAERIMVLAEGAVLAEGTSAEIAADERVQAAYLGKAA